ncbi:MULTISPECIES: Hpt domain-containing protein [unclassified Brevundimonas]|uniref:Hpt domain-containing protein n=1 Tax=unclassified Brevundimonas TaxID=2622653 RepID=UPI0025B832C4|nr:MULTISPECIES: Hpt domain-containing protein [unclassified Brevundimonas]
MAQPPELIRRPNALRSKLGGGFGGIDAAAVARAEEALKALSSQFDQWLQDEIVKLDTAEADIRADGYTEKTAEYLYLRAHDLKGLGTTYQYPLVTRIAGSLCRLMDDPSRRMVAPWPLVEAHINAIRAVVRDRIQAEDHPVGTELANALEAEVRALGL